MGALRIRGHGQQHTSLLCCNVFSAAMKAMTTLIGNFRRNLLGGGYDAMETIESSPIQLHSINFDSMFSGIGCCATVLFCKAFSGFFLEP